MNGTAKRSKCPVRDSGDLDEGEAFHGTVLDTVDALVVALDRDSRIVFFNRTCERLTGYTFEEVAGRHPWSVLVPPEDADSVRAELAVRDAGWFPRRLESSWLARDGSRHLISWTHAAVVDDGGKVDYVVATGIDITDRRKAEAGLRGREREFRQLFDAIPFRVAYCDAEQRLRLTNRHYDEWFEAEPGSLIGKTACEVMGEEGYARVRSQMEQALAGGTSRFEGEITYRLHGKRFTSAAYVPNVAPDGRVVGFYAFIQDITERKHQEMLTTRLGRIIEHSLNEIFLFDAASLRFILVNRGARRNLGYSLAELRALTPLDLKPGFTRERFEELLRPLRTGQQDQIVFETLHRRKDGSAYDVEVHLQLMSRETPPVFVAIIQDVTESRRQQQRLRRYFELPLVGTALYAPDKRWIEVNDKLCDLLGYDRDELEQLSWVDVTHPDDVEANLRLFDEAVTGNRDSYTMDKRFIRKDGAILHASIAVECVRRPDGAPDYFMLLVQDLSERKRAEEALRESRRRFEDFAEAASDWFWETGPDLRFTWVSDRFEQVTGAPPEAILGKTRWDLAGIDPEHHEAWRKHRKDMQAHKPVRDFRYAFRGATGESHTMSVSGKPVFDETGRFLGYRGTATDVTAEVAAREQLLDAIESLTEAFALYDAEDRLVLCNSNFRKFYGLSEDVLVPGVKFEDHARINAYRGQFPDAVGREEAWIAERVRRHLDPTGPHEQKLDDGRWLRVSERRTRGGGIVGVRTDITELKRREEALRESEERFRYLIEGSNQGVFIHRDWRPLFVNRAFARMLGYGSPEEILAMPSLEPLFAPQERARLKAYRDARMHGESAPTQFEFDAVHKDGSCVTYENLTTLITWKGEPAVQSAVIDITERKLAEERLRQSQKLEVVGQLTGGVAHDFNNILAVILGNLELLEERLDPDEERHELAEAGIRSARRGAELTQRLLAFSRRQALNPVVTDLNNLVSGMTDMLRRTLGETIEIETALAGDLRKTLIDPGQLESAILNLAVNARDAIPRAGRLTIETANADIGAADARRHPELAPGRFVRLSVTDDGTGMAPEVVGQAFEPFFTTKEVGRGSGLGLSMVYGFIKQSGGHVQIDSEIGRGTTVRVYLPVAVGPQARSSKKPPVEVEVPGAGERILVVEDDPEVRRLSTRLLASLGYRVLEAADGPRALARLGATDAVDLLLTDVVLPRGMNGIDLAAKARAAHPGLKVLYMSGYTEEASFRDRIVGEGMMLLGKPFRKAELARKVREALDATDRG